MTESVEHAGRNGTANGRGADGKFKPGNAGGPGRPPRAPNTLREFRTVVEEQAYKHGIDLEAATWRVVKAMIKAAEKGDAKAAQLLLNRLFGKEPLQLQTKDLTLEQILGESMRPRTYGEREKQLRADIDAVRAGAETGEVDMNAILRLAEHAEQHAPPIPVGPLDIVTGIPMDDPDHDRN